MQARLQTLGSTAAAFSRHFLGSGVTGPQLAASLHVRTGPPGAPDGGSPAGPPPAQVHVQVGQLLTALRFASSNRLLPLTSQILALVRERGPRAGFGRPANKTASNAGGSESSAVDTARSGGEAPPAEAAGAGGGGAAVAAVEEAPWFPGIRVGLTAVGLDAVLAVEGRELVGFQLVDAALHAHVAASGGPGPAEPAPTTLGLQVGRLIFSGAFLLWRKDSRLLMLYQGKGATQTRTLLKRRIPVDQRQVQARVWPAGGRSSTCRTCRRRPRLIVVCRPS